MLYIMFYQFLGVLATLYIRPGTIHRYIQHDNVYLLSAVPLTDIAPTFLISVVLFSGE